MLLFNATHRLRLTYTYLNFNTPRIIAAMTIAPTTAPMIGPVFDLNVHHRSHITVNHNYWATYIRS